MMGQLNAGNMIGCLVPLVIVNPSRGIVQDLHTYSDGEFEGAKNCPNCLIVSWNGYISCPRSL